MEMQIPTTMIYTILTLELLQKEGKEKKGKRVKKYQMLIKMQNPWNSIHTLLVRL